LDLLIGALTGGKFLGGADTSMTPMDRYNQNTFGGYGNMGVQDRYGINTVSFFGDYNRYANRMANKQGPFQSYYQDVVNKQNKQEAQQFADIRQQSESSGGYNPSTGYTAETGDLAGTGSGSQSSLHFLIMARKSALEKIEYHEKICRIMQRQTFEQIQQLKNQIIRIERILIGTAAFVIISLLEKII
jgi:hypothetical protein